MTKNSLSLILILVAILPLIHFFGNSLVTAIPDVQATSSSVVISSKPEISLSKPSLTSADLPLTFKLLVYNIQDSGRDGAWLAVAEEENADIIITVETGLWGNDNDTMLNEAIDSLNNYFPDETPYEGYTLHEQERASEGQSVISRFPIINASEVRILQLDDGTEYDPYYDLIDVVVDIGGTQVHVAGIHLKCCGDVTGLTAPKADEHILREKEQEGIINYFDSLGSVPIIYAGDFNSYSPFDTGELAPSTPNLGDGPISMLLNSSNPHASTVHKWIDVYRELNPTEKGYTYIDWQYKSRIDFIFANDYFTDKLINSTVASTPSGKNASDHYSLNAFFNMEPDKFDLRPPYKVTGVNGTIVNSTAVNITWTANSEGDLSHYRVVRDNAVVAAQVDTNYFVDNSLTPGSLHYFTISAVDNSSNEGLQSNLLIANTSYGICQRPDPPEMTATGGEGNITLEWIKPDNGGLPLIGYQLYRAYIFPHSGYELISIYPSGNRAFIISPNVTNYVDSNIQPGKNYSYFITAINELGESAKSARASAIASPGAISTTISSTEKVTPFNGLSSLSALLIMLILKKKGKKHR
ncbi:MAG: endonuclease/exonuclease/phosphatase family protein [Candidatus Hodarchaeales archaeon]